MTCQNIYKKSRKEKKVIEKFSSLCGQMVGSLLNMGSPQFDLQPKKNHGKN